MTIWAAYIWSSWLLPNKVVEGSGSMGTSNYVGEGVALWIKLGHKTHLLRAFCMWCATWCLASGYMPHLAWCSVTILDDDITNGHDIIKLHHSHVLVKGYKRHRMAPLGVLPWVIWGWDTHMHRDWYTKHPHFSSLLPSKIIDWVELFVITMSVHTMWMLLHILGVSHEHCHYLY